MKIIEKVATQIADSVITSLRENGDFQRRLRESDQAREIEGKDALSALRRLRGKKLAAGEEIILARRLYDEVQIVKRQLRTEERGIGRFCIDAGIADVSQSSKELHRLTLAPGKNPNEVRLRRTGDKYYRLIIAISKTTKENASTLADRVLRGTSLHPAKNIGNLSETEMVQTALQGIVDKVDGEFGIFAKYMEIAELKVRHVTSGGKENWPKTDWLLEPDWYEFEQELADAMNLDFAFWKSAREPDLVEQERLAKLFAKISSSNEQSDAFLEQPEPRCRVATYRDSGASQDDSFFYVPHVPLGMTDCFNLPDRQEDPSSFEKSVLRITEEYRKIDNSTGLSWIGRSRAVTDQWNEESNRPFGQTLDGMDSTVSADYAWIVIYPMPDSARLKPMLYMHQQEGGAYLVPLDARNLDLLRDALWLDETRHMSVFDRIKEMLGYQSGTPRTIEDGFRRTAPWLDHNPFFKMRNEKTEDLRLLGNFCQQYWASNIQEPTQKGAAK